MENIAVTVKVQLPEVKGERDAYHLVIFDETGSDVLLESRGTECHLPLIEIPKYTRPAYEITTSFRDHRQLSSVLLFSGALEQDADARYFAALQVHEKASSIPKGTAWFRVDDAIDHLLQGAEHRVLDSSYAKATGKKWRRLRTIRQTELDNRPSRLGKNGDWAPRPGVERISAA